MLKRLLTSLALLAIAPVLPAANAVAPAAPVALFNGTDLSGWTKFVRPGEVPAAATWTVANGVIKCTGQPAGYIRTEGRYRNYRLTVEWRWTGPDLAPDAQGRPRRRNSGVLLHTQAPDAIWPQSLEAQLMESNAGDFYSIGGVETAELASVRDQAVAAAGTDEEALKRARASRRVPRAAESSEKPVGEWNTYDITCAGNTVTLRVNGVVQNRATAISVNEGHICLQSEGAAIEFRHVRLAPLE